MGFGQTLNGVIKERGETVTEFSKRVHLDNSTTGKYIKGKRNIPKHVAREIVEECDDAFLSISANDEFSGGASVPLLTNADLYKSTTHLKATEETQEAMDAMSKIPITKRKDQLSEQDMKRIKDALIECIEAITALTTYVAVLCREYCFSWLGLWREHRQELKDKKYIA